VEVITNISGDFDGARREGSDAAVADFVAAAGITPALSLALSEKSPYV
jgi:hypothetical protein